MEQMPLPRRAARHPLTMNARCRTAAGMRDEAFISDISTHGCCMETRSLHLSIGVRVIVKPEGMEGITGTVRWINGHCAGIAFEAPLYGPIVAHLIANNPDRLRTAPHARLR